LQREHKEIYRYKPKECDVKIYPAQSILFNHVRIAMKEGKGNIWFPAKKYGVGWGLPVTWQGWMVLLAYVLLLVIGAKVMTDSPILIFPFIAYVLVLTGLLIFICWKKGEKIDFRWGKNIRRRE
jgi:hypothetical protein